MHVYGDRPFRWSNMINDDGKDYDPQQRGMLHDIHVEVGGRSVAFKLGGKPEWDGVYEPEVCNIIGHFVKPGDLVVDAGASVGFFTVLLSHVVGPDGIVLSFEPEKRSNALLRQNVAVNELTNTVVYPCGLFSGVGVLELWNHGPCGYTSVSKQDHETAIAEQVPVIALDALLHDQPRFIKIDC